MGAKITSREERRRDFHNARMAGGGKRIYLINNLPDYTQNRQSRGLAQRVSQNLGTSSPPYLSIMGNKVTLVDAAGNEQTLPTYETDPNKCIRGQSPAPYADVVIIDV